MIGAPQVVETALAEAARLGRADETIVLVTDRSTASLRWAGNSMTTNGESSSREYHGDFDCPPRRQGLRRLGDVKRGRYRRRSPGWSPPRRTPPARRPRRGRRTGAARRRTARRLGRPGARDGCRRLRRRRRESWRRAFAARTGSTASPGTNWTRRCGHLERSAAALHPADGLGRDQRQARRRQCVGRRQHPRLRRCTNRFHARGPVDAPGLGRAGPSSFPRAATRR